MQPRVAEGVGANREESVDVILMKACLILYGERAWGETWYESLGLRRLKLINMLVGSPEI